MENITKEKSSVLELGPASAPSGNQDKDFPANDKSLGAKHLRKGSKLGWKDFSKDGQLVMDNVSASDIRQGSLGSCYLLSAIAALCERNPNFVKSILLDNGNGKFGVRWYPAGRPADTWVDASFPVKNGKLRFAHSEKNELWVAAIEKGNFKAISHYNLLLLSLFTIVAFYFLILYFPCSLREVPW